MLYDRRSFAVVAGRPVAIVFQNDDLMPHNLVVTAPGALEAVGTAAEALALDPGAQAKSFVPELPAVLQQLKLLMPGESATLRFVAPSELGDYPYVCTFPGHWRVMNGVMHVVASEQDVAKAEQAAPATPISVPPAADARAFVRMWTVDDLKTAFPSGWERARSLARGHEVFVTAGCVKCHGFRGEGVKSAPELGEITKKYRDLELLRQIVEPSVALLEGYENRVLELLNGDSAVGRVVGESPEGWRIAANLQEPDKTELVRREDVKSQRPSKLSPMPTGLLVTFTRDEILDLIAFLQTPAPEQN